MAIINCPECGKKISDKALSCPNCGYPINQNLSMSNGLVQGDQDSAPLVEESMSPVMTCPEFPVDLAIGQQITNWKFDSALKGIYSEQLSTLKGILPSGEADILLHSHGVRIMVGLNKYDIHNSQIISIIKTSSAELGQVNKSVVGRAVLGDIIMGPLGAIVGGMSGIGTKSAIIVTQYVAINFWDVNSKTPQTILISCNGNHPIEAFINRREKENKINFSQNREAEQEHMPIWAIICIIIIIISVCIIFLL